MKCAKNISYLQEGVITDTNGWLSFILKIIVYGNRLKKEQVQSVINTES